MKKYFAIVIAVILPCMLIAQVVKPIIIETQHLALVLTVGNNKRVNQSYLGKKAGTRRI